MPPDRLTRTAQGDYDANDVIEFDELTSASK